MIYTMYLVHVVCPVDVCLFRSILPCLRKRIIEHGDLDFYRFLTFDVSYPTDTLIRIMRRAVLAARTHTPHYARAGPAVLSSSPAGSSWSTIASTSASSSPSSSSAISGPSHSQCCRHLHTPRRQYAQSISLNGTVSSSSSLSSSYPSYRSQSSSLTPPIHLPISARRTYATESKDQHNKNKNDKQEVEKGKNDSSEDGQKGNSGNDKQPSSKSPIPGLESLFGGRLGQQPPSSSSSNKPSRTSGFPFGLGQESGKDTEVDHLNKAANAEKGSSSNHNSSSSGGGSGGSPQPPQGLAPYLFPLAALLVFHFITNTESGSREITWQEFRTAFLDKGLVDKLTVVNRSRVRVHLHSNATGVLYPQSPAADGRSTYYFSIGSVEAFERKLDEAQAELGIPSSERVPVAYKEETSISNTLLSFAPTLLIVGVLYFLSRRAGGAGGAGGPGGIFGVGKSKARMFNVSLPWLNKVPC